MSVHVPDATQLVILVLGTFRLVRLVGWDDITTSLRGRLTGIPDDDYKECAQVVSNAVKKGIDPWTQRVPNAVAFPDAGADQVGSVRVPVSHFRFDMARMVRCPWCVGFWLSLAVWLAFASWPRATLFGCLLGALSAGVGLVAKNLDP